MSSHNEESGTNQEEREERRTDEVMGEMNQKHRDSHTNDSVPEKQRLSPDDEQNDVSYRLKNVVFYRTWHFCIIVSLHFA